MIRFFRKLRVTVKIQGGLGNQLFQIAAALHYAKKYNFKPVFSKDKVLHERKGAVGGETYWDIFNTTGLLELTKIKKKYFKTQEQPDCNYTAFSKSNENILLEGYFQSSKYVDCVRNEMIELLWSNSEVSKKVQLLYSKIVNTYNSEELISLHIRRGDYTKLSNIHTNLGLDYYIDAVKKFPQELPLIIFSDDQDWCKENLSKELDNSMYFVSEKDYIEILLMSKIKNNIIANSSFSWWAAYTNEHELKKVIAPRNWYGPDSRNKDWSDVYCKGWEVL